LNTCISAGVLQGLVEYMHISRGFAGGALVAGCNGKMAKSGRKEKEKEKKKKGEAKAVNIVREEW
jgi:hypothetical protein